MALRVAELRDPAEASEQSHAFLVTRPALHNLLLTILDDARERALDGRYWIARDRNAVVGFALQSPTGNRVALACMDPDAIRAIVDATGAVPGVIGDAPGAATFAGHFAARHHVAITGVNAGRLYELGDLHAIATAPGTLRPAAHEHRALLAQWARDFAGETATPATEAQRVIDAGIAGDRLWLWDDSGPVSMTGAAGPRAGVARVLRVYTPPPRRGRGYATACVEQVSRLLTDRGLRCVLYTDLANPTSNAIYARIGYAPIAEILGYDFGGGAPGGDAAGPGG